ncbi:MAG TPA: DUF1206 domain-containing protein [Acidimicrobiales bacterium]
MSTVDAVAGRVRRARRAGNDVRDSRWFAWAGRVGHVAKAVSYAAIAVLALQVAFGDRAQPEDRQGVLRELADQPFGGTMLWVLAVGFGAYALWQFVRAALDRNRDGSDVEGLAKRAHHAGVGAIYVASMLAAASLARGESSGGGGGGGSGDEKAETARVLEWPGGQWIVGAFGLALIGYGVYNLVKAKNQKFRKDLDEASMGPAVRTWTTRSGVVGHAARGVVLGMVGFFLAKAAWEYDPDEAVGIDGALARLAQQGYGTWLLSAVALGLLAYAVFCLVQARYRRV